MTFNRLGENTIGYPKMEGKNQMKVGGRDMVAQKKGGRGEGNIENVLMNPGVLV